MHELKLLIINRFFKNLSKDQDDSKVAELDSRDSACRQCSSHCAE